MRFEVPFQANKSKELITSVTVYCLKVSQCKNRCVVFDPMMQLIMTKLFLLYTSINKLDGHANRFCGYAQSKLGVDF